MTEPTPDYEALLTRREAVRASLTSQLQPVLAMKEEFALVKEALKITNNSYGTHFTRTWQYSPYDQHDYNNYPNTDYSLFSCLEDFQNAARNHQQPNLSVEANVADEQREPEPEVIYGSFRQLIGLMRTDFQESINYVAAKISADISEGSLPADTQKNKKLIAGFTLLQGIDTAQHSGLLDRLAKIADWQQVDEQIKEIADITKQLPAHLKYTQVGMSPLVNAGKALLAQMGIQPAMPDPAAAKEKQQKPPKAAR